MDAGRGGTGWTLFCVLVRARGRMLANAVRSSSGRQRWVIGGLAAFGLLFVGGVCVLSGALLTLAQAGAPLGSGLTPNASALAERAYEYLFFFLLAGSVPFVASTLFQADDLPLLLTTPTDVRAIVGAKLLDAAAVNAAQSAALGLPVLVGIGWAAGLSVFGWLWLTVAAALLLAIPPLATAGLLLMAAHALGMRRVRVAVTVVSVGLGLAITCLAVVGASRAAQGGGLDMARLQAALRGEAVSAQPPSGKEALTPQSPLPQAGESKPVAITPHPRPLAGEGQARSASARAVRAMRSASARAVSGTPSADARTSFPSVLPSAWAAQMLEDTAGGRGLSQNGWAGLGALLLAAGALIGLCLPLGARVLASDAFLEPLDSGRVQTNTAATRAGWTRGIASPIWGLLTKDARYLRRDLILLGQMGTALLLFLVPLLLRAAQGKSAGADSDLYGDLALGMLGLILYLVTSIVSLTSVGLEGRAAWLVLAAPVARGQFVRAKWLGAFLVSAGTVGVLTLLAWPLFGLGAMQVGAALLCLGPACFALSGLGVGLAGLFPRFVYENPAHRASVWALLLGFVLATGYLILCGLFAVGAALLPAQGVIGARTAGTLGIGLFVLLSLATGLVPVLLAARRLRDYEWEF